MLSRTSNLGGGKFGVKCYLETPIWGGVENLGGNAVSNLEFGGWKIWGGKCYLESRIWGVEYLGWKMLSRNSNLGGGGKFGWKMLPRISNLGCGKFGVKNVISNLEFGGWKIWGGKFGVENAISNLAFGGWKIWGGKCYLESRIWEVENLGRKMLSRISNLGGEVNLGWKMLSRNF